MNLNPPAQGSITVNQLNQAAVAWFTADSPAGAHGGRSTVLVCGRCSDIHKVQGESCAPIAALCFASEMNSNINNYWATTLYRHVTQKRALMTQSSELFSIAP